METYYGYIRTPQDAVLVFEACRLNKLCRVQRRLSERERNNIRSGSVFVWDEREAGMRRWTDGKSWSASRVSGNFLTYREMEGKRSISSNSNRCRIKHSPEGTDDSDDCRVDDESYRYKPDGFMKQSFSITTSDGRKLHLISYSCRPQSSINSLPVPSQDPMLRDIVPPKNLYPDTTTASDQSHRQNSVSYSRISSKHKYEWPLSPASTPPSQHPAACSNPHTSRLLFAPTPYQQQQYNPTTQGWNLARRTSSGLLAYDPPVYDRWQEEFRALDRLNAGLPRVFC